MKSVYRFSFIVFLIVFFDQLTKFFASKLTNSVVIIKDFFQLSLVHNTGAAFGLFKDLNIFLIVVSVVVLVGFGFYFKKVPKDHPTQIAATLIIGGTIGNLIDRIRFGFVIDFFSFSFWPSFNIADSALVVGAIILIVVYWNK